MANLLYDDFVQKLGEKDYDMGVDTFKIALLSDGYTPLATHTTYANVSANELSNGNGYTTGGATLTSVAWTETGGTAKFDADDAQWAAANFTARYAVIYNTTVLNELVCLIDFTENKQASGVTFEIRFNTNGILTLAQA